MLAKCGTQKVWHWAHKGRLTCDPWWEPETEWHRAWKNQFPISWQEVPLRSKETGELHIADVQTPHGLVMEFQHSAIDPAELASRERFYENMLWVVDGTRLASDRARIDERLPRWRWLPERIVEKCGGPSAVFPRRWLNCKKPVLFDFSGHASSPDGTPPDHLICLMPERYRGDALYFPVRRSTLIEVGDGIEGGPRILHWTELHKLMIESELAARSRRYRLR